MADRFMKAGTEMGYPITEMNGKYGTGIMSPQVTHRNGRRCSTAKAFLRPIRN